MKLVHLNIFELDREKNENCHHGDGVIEMCRVLNQNDFISNCNFVDYAIIPPGCSIGIHKHGNNEEFYLILEGNGIMTVDYQQFNVKKGDLILNRPGGEHGLINNSKKVLKIFVIEINC